MFSRDPKHYRPVPRTLEQAFGSGTSPLLTAARKQARRDVIHVALGIVALGVVYGLLFGWGGVMEPYVKHATLRVSEDGDWIDIECRMSDGQKGAFVQVSSDFPELAAEICRDLTRTSDSA